MNIKNKINILNTYITHECNLRQCEAKDTSTMMRIESFINYRNTRIKQQWYNAITQGKNDPKIAVERNKIDKERRENHNLALNSLVGFNSFAKKFNLPCLYEGNLLTPEEIKEHASPSYDTRMEMTDWFLGFIQELTDYNTKEIKEASIKSFYDSLKDNVYKFDRDYNVEEPLTKDNGDIKVKDQKKEYSDPSL